MSTNCYINAFANHSKEEENFSLTISEIADAQQPDSSLCKFFKRGCKYIALATESYHISLVEDIKVLTNSSLKLVIPKSL